MVTNEEEKIEPLPFIGFFQSVGSPSDEGFRDILYSQGGLDPLIRRHMEWSKYGSNLKGILIELYFEGRWDPIGSGVLRGEAIRFIGYKKRNQWAEVAVLIKENEINQLQAVGRKSFLCKKISQCIEMVLRGVKKGRFKVDSDKMRDDFAKVCDDFLTA